MPKDQRMDMHGWGFAGSCFCASWGMPQRMDKHDIGTSTTSQSMFAIMCTIDPSPPTRKEAKAKAGVPRSRATSR
jgi:hypothetical protein